MHMVENKDFILFETRKQTIMKTGFHFQNKRVPYTSKKKLL